MDVNLTLVARGEWVALLGPNASGKSTLLHCVAGMMAPKSGAVVICGHSLQGDPCRERKGSWGLLVRPNCLPGLLTGRQVPGNLRRRERAAVNRCTDVLRIRRELSSI